MQPLIFVAMHAFAGEVVWVGDRPDEATWTDVIALTGAVGQPLSPMEFRAASTRLTEADADAYRQLSTTLRGVREYETRLDGELVIMRDLERAIDAIDIVRDDADREALYAALAYQGFAVQRYFDGDTTDEASVPYYVDVLERSWVRPWVDALALAPDREPTAYDIAEAPQRVAFSDARSVLKDALPAAVVLPQALPEGAQLVVGGEALPVTPGQAIQLLPGRHRLHLQVDGEVLTRWELSLQSAGEQTLSLPVDEAAWSAWVSSLEAGAPTALPTGLQDDIAALGEPPFLARFEGGTLDLFRLDADGVPTPVETRAKRSKPTRSSGVGWSVGVGLDGVVVYSGDFYTQDPTQPHNRATVNAAGLALDVQATVEVGLFRFGGGVDTAVPFGEAHVALTGDQGSMRVRPYVYGVAGIRFAQISAGFLFPYHPAAGLHLTIPLYKGLELRGNGLIGFRGEQARADDTVYARQRFSRFGVGLGWRFQ